MNLEAALAYAQRHTLHAFVALCGGEVVLERYANGWSAERAHALYSGTKSFWGVAAVAAESDGLLSLDEPVADTLPEWRGDARKRRVTLRHLLTLTAGIPFGGLGSAVPTYERALATTLAAEPGERFTYGGIPLQVVGAVLARKLAPRFSSPHAYLFARILDPIGMQVDRWRTLADGTHPLPTGAFVTAQQWLRFGRLVRDGGRWNGASVVPEDALARCFIGTDANPRYGLGWWLGSGVAYASGSGGQALYVLRAADTVVVKFGAGAGYKHETFLRRMGAGSC